MEETHPTNTSYHVMMRPTESILKEKGSKFIAYAFPVISEGEVQDILHKLKHDHPKARHFCYAYRLAPPESIWRSSDDGEPRNSAGQPIYRQILSEELFETLIVVVRYFGGTKLGVSGLVSAYKTAAKEAISLVEKAQKFPMKKVHLTIRYERLEKALRTMHHFDAQLVHQDHREKSHLTIELPCEKWEAFRQAVAAVLGEEDSLYSA